MKRSKTGSEVMHSANATQRAKHGNAKFHDKRQTVPSPPIINQQLSPGSEEDLDEERINTGDSKIKDLQQTVSAVNIHNLHFGGGGLPGA